MLQNTSMYTYHVNPLFRCLEKGDNVGVLSHSLMTYLPVQATTTYKKF